MCSILLTIKPIIIYLQKIYIQDILVGKKLFETPADSKAELHPGCP